MKNNKYELSMINFEDIKTEFEAIDYFHYCKQKNSDIPEQRKYLIPNCSKKWFKNNNLLRLRYNKKAESQSGLFSDKKKIKDYLKTLIPSSFAVNGKFTLASPYYSADDEKYSIFDNPLLKEKVFKVPMMRGSSWKGVIASAARAVLEQEFSVENILSFGRLFGSGSEDFRKIEKKAITQNYTSGFEKDLLYYALMKFGKVTVKKMNTEEQKKELWNKIKEKKLQTQRGRLVFYPSYFNQIGLEMINPHKRRTKAGTHPIYYEVVPAGAEATFQLLYIPADNITKSDEERKKEYEHDKKLITTALKLIFQEHEDKAQIKIGAKTKLGWGRITPISDDDFNKMIVEVKDEQ